MSLTNETSVRAADFVNDPNEMVERADTFAKQLLATLDEMSNDERWNAAVREGIVAQQVMIYANAAHARGYAAGMARMQEAHLASLHRIGNAIGTPTGSWGNEAERKALLDRVQKVSKLVQDEIRVAAPGAEGEK